MVETSTLVEVLHSYSNKARHYLYRLDQIVEAKPCAAAVAFVERPKHRRTSRARVALRMDASDKLELLERYKAGASSRELAQAFGISKTSVVQLVRKAGVPIRRQGLTAVQVREAARLYNEGQSLARIGQRFAVSPGCVRQSLIRQGAKIRRP